MKNCPYCSELIKDGAIKCKYCKSFIQDEEKPKGISYSQAKKYQKRGFIILFTLPAVGIIRFIVSIIFRLISLVGEGQNTDLLNVVKGGINWILGMIALFGLILIPVGIYFLVKRSRYKKELTIDRGQLSERYEGLTQEQIDYIHSFSRRAFFGGIIWPLGNRLRGWALGKLVPIFNIYVRIKLSIDGKKMARENHEWKSFESFKKNQKILSRVIVIRLIVFIPLSILGNLGEYASEYSDSLEDAEKFDTILSQGTEGDLDDFEPESEERKILKDCMEGDLPKMNELNEAMLSHMDTLNETIELIGSAELETIEEMESIVSKLTHTISDLDQFQSKNETAKTTYNGMNNKCITSLIESGYDTEEYELESDMTEFFATRKELIETRKEYFNFLISLFNSIIDGTDFYMSDTEVDTYETNILEKANNLTDKYNELLFEE